VLAPLRMESTGIELSVSLRRRRAIGHNPQLDPVAAWPSGTFESAGGLKSSADDLLNFLDAAMNGSSSTLDKAFAEMLRWQRPGPGFAQTLGWRLQQIDGQPLIVHDGASFSHAATMTYDPTSRIGVVVLSNAAPVVGDLARHILRPSYRLNQNRPIPHRVEIALDTRELDKYVGRYRMPAGMTFVVARHENRLTFRAPFSPEMYLRAASHTEFFVPELGFDVSFVFEATGAVSELRFSALGQPATSALRVNP
jgi:serine-type D-Ala-D-Ala carboxypeptidase/endopeptidase